MSLTLQVFVVGSQLPVLQAVGAEAQLAPKATLHCLAPVVPEHRLLRHWLLSVQDSRRAFFACTASGKTGRQPQ